MKKRLLLFAGINALCLIIYIVLTVVSRNISSSFDSQKVVDKWLGSNDTTIFTYISVFLSDDKNLKKEDILMGRSKLESSLAVDGINNVSENEDATSWTDAYSSHDTELKITREGFSADVTAMPVGRNYFFFHPLKIISGDYFYDYDLMKDRIVIDNYTAWQLFGSYDVAGMNVDINGRTFLVAGVYERPEDKFTDYTYGEKSRIYIPYETYYSMDTNSCITSYEVCMPNPVSGYAVKLVSESFSFAESDDIIETSQRFSDKNMWKYLKNLNRYMIDDNNIYYPYFENSQRIAQVEIAKILLYRVISLVPVAVSVVSIIIYGYIKLKKNKKLIIHKIADFFKKEYVKIKKHKGNNKIVAENTK